MDATYGAEPASLLGISCPFSPTGASEDPIWVSSQSPKKKKAKFSTLTHINKAKKRYRLTSPADIVALPSRQLSKSSQTPSARPWPLTIVSDSLDEASLMSMRVGPTWTISTHGRTRCVHRTRCQVAPSSPRYTLPPDDMFLPNTPPAGENTLSTSAVPAPVSLSDDMYLPNTSPCRGYYSSCFWISGCCFCVRCTCSYFCICSSTPPITF